MRRLPPLLLLPVLLRAGVDLLRLVGDGTRYDNAEERYTATVGWYVAHAGLADQLLTMQYKAFCGGCTVEGLAAATTLGLFGDHLGAWKAWALAWTAAIHVVGFLALDRQVNRTAAWAWALLFAVPPPGVADLGLMLWGNHAEGGLFVVAALALPAGFWQGLVIGLGLWFTRTTAHSLLLVVLGLMSREWRVLPGLLLGLAPTLLPAAAGDLGTYDLGLRANLLPKGLSWAWARLATLLGPSALGPRLLPTVSDGARWTTTWLVALVLSVAILRRHVLVALIAGFVLLWGVSGFELPKALPHAALLQHRYHAPFLLLGLLVVAGAAGRLRPLPRAGLLALALAAPLAGNAQILPRLRPDFARLASPVVDHAWFAGIVYRRLPLARVQAAHSDDRATEAALRRLEGYVAADVARVDPAVRGRISVETVSAWWQARTDPKASWSDLAALNAAVAADPDPVAAGRGAANNLAWDAPKGALVPRLREGLADGEACRLCAAAGMQIGWSCPDTACLREELQGPDAAELAFGAALVFAPDDEAVGSAADPVGAAWRAGRDSVLRGQRAPFFPQRAPKAGRSGRMPQR